MDDDLPDNMKENLFEKKLDIREYEEGMLCDDLEMFYAYKLLVSWMAKEARNKYESRRFFKSKDAKRLANSASEVLYLINERNLHYNYIAKSSYGVFINEVLDHIHSTFEPGMCSLIAHRLHDYQSMRGLTVEEVLDMHPEFFYVFHMEAKNHELFERWCKLNPNVDIEELRRAYNKRLESSMQGVSA